MDFLRTRVVMALVALAATFATPACGDDDGKGASEEIEKGAGEAKDGIEKEGRELEDDVEGQSK